MTPDAGPPATGSGRLPVYVIHAAFMTERRESITDQLDRAGLAFEFVLGNDPGQFDPALVGKYLTVGRKLRPGAVSCLLKHVATYEMILARQQDEALILEDDVLLEPDFAARLAAVRQ